MALVLLTALGGCGANAARHYDAPAMAPLSHDLTLDVADTAMAGNAPELALHVTQTILAKEPANVAALQRQGEAYLALGQVAQAERSYRHALAIRPDFAAAQLGLGRVELTRDPTAAAARFLQVLASDPHNLVALNDDGVALDLRGDHADAQVVYRRVLALVPGDSAAQVNLGLSLALSSNAAAALALLQPLATLPDATARVRHDYAVALVIAGREVEAEQVLRADLPPDQAAVAVRSYRQLPAANILPANLN